MVHKLTDDAFEVILNVVNDAAVVYKGKIPVDCWKTPYMPRDELQTEIDSGVQFYGITQDNTLVAVMGIQRVGDVTLIRHAYTLTRFQRKGLGEKLLNYLLTLAETKRILVGTWAAAPWAIRFYQKHGFKLVSTQEKDYLLHKYWNILERQVETSVVLELEETRLETNPDAEG